MNRIPTGAKALDELLGGGIERGALTQVYGEGGAGKTGIAVQFAVEAAERGKAIFVDTEGFPAERFGQIATRPEETAENLLIYEPRSLEEQHAAMRDVDEVAEERGDLEAVIIDSVAPFYRVELQDDADARRDLASQLTFLTGSAREHDLAVLFTNQVFTDPDSGRAKPLGGTMMDHLSKTIVELRKTGSRERMATLRKHRSRPEGKSCGLILTETGIRG